jgi:hypothetical protein
LLATVLCLLPAARCHDALRHGSFAACADVAGAGAGLINFININLFNQSRIPPPPPPPIL